MASRKKIACNGDLYESGEERYAAYLAEVRQFGHLTHVPSPVEIDARKAEARAKWRGGLQAARAIPTALRQLS